ncbi:MAG: glucose-methanol-choline oxidoreductase [Gammaproteobacteria bacterium]|nr:glucose-methanol-choline oxidoreductase [Gammaproteobacteria bacterium]
MSNESFDYVVVGGGSAGCVLANRLSEDPSVSVALIEAGGEHNQFLINMPLGYGKTIYSPKYSWDIHTEPEPGSNDRTFYLPRGRVLGGSSSINGLLYIRGQHEDYDDWAAGGATGWAWEDVKPYFKKSEDQCRGENEWHGAGGLQRVDDARDSYPIEQSLIEAGVNAGLRRNDDFNGERQDGIGRYQATMKGGQRWSTANAFLDPARSRHNLTVLTDTMVERVEFTGRRATGVAVRVGGSRRSIGVNREVLLCAGALQSPQLLQLSGIGAGELLQRHGIDVLLDSSGVGANLHDHVGAAMSWKLKSNTDSLNYRLRFPNMMFEAIRYIFTKRGIMAMPAASVGIFADSSGQGGRPDLQYHCLPVTGDLKAEAEEGHMVLDPFPGLTMMPYPTRPRSRGSLEIKSPDASVMPSVRMNWFSDPNDMEVLLRGMRLAQKIADTQPLASRIDSRVYPGPDDDSDDAYIDFVQRYSHVAYHPVGTCRMGGDEASVVDCDLKVRGVDGLRVVDGSVIPAVPSGNTNAPIIMIAEKISETIRKDQS